ncbi:MAG: DsbA family protein [Rickettsiaceae bacterium H1]|nr:DsbA family protein [Rickettsiaceae bacterium H1]
MKIKITFLTLLIVLLSIGNGNSNNTKFREFFPQDYVTPEGKVLPKDQYMGNIHAPITMVEYASFSCIHCATFSKTVLPLIKEKYIDTGKVFFIFRDFPLDEPALKAGIFANCYASDKYCNDDNKLCAGNYFAIYHALFDSLEYWASGTNIVKNLKEVAKIGKMDVKRFDSCMQDKSIQEKIINSKIYAIRNLNINSTPIFIINKVKYEGIRNLEFFTKTFDEILATTS